MAEVMREGNRFRQIGIQSQRAGNVARNGCDFNRVREPRAQMVAGAVEKNLCLVFEPAKGARMNDAVAVTLILCAPFGRRFGKFASTGVAAKLRKRSERFSFDLFEFLSRARHEINSLAIPELKFRAIQTAGEWCLQSNCSGSWRRR